MVKVGLSHLFLLRTSSRAAVIEPLSAANNLHNPIKKYSKGSDDDGTEERAPSLAKEFERVSEEKSKAEEERKGAEQGMASQTMEKVYDGAEEATLGDGESKVDSAKNRYKEHEGGADYHRKPPSDAGVTGFGSVP